MIQSKSVDALLATKFTVSRCSTTTLAHDREIQANCKTKATYLDEVEAAWSNHSSSNKKSIDDWLLDNFKQYTKYLHQGEGCRKTQDT